MEGERRHKELNLRYFLLWMRFQPSVPASGLTRLGLEAKKEEDLPEWYSQVNSTKI